VLVLHTADPNEVAELQRAAGSNFALQVLPIATAGTEILAS
jgi:hypothetical protein